jgi:hypothetical protein
MREEVDLLTSDLEHGGPLAIGRRPFLSQECETEPLIEVDRLVEARDLEADVIENLQAHHQRASREILRLDFEMFMIGPAVTMLASWSAGS